MMPTEVNIADSICYGYPKHCNTEVKKALDCAIEQHMVVKKIEGNLKLYLAKNKQLWEFLNPDDGNIDQYPNSIWDKMHDFLTSEAGSSAIMSSRCRYEAAFLLKSACLNNLPLGEVLQILNLLISIKRWILPHHLGWEPLTIALLPKN